jgi:hypothetical protein
MGHVHYPYFKKITTDEEPQYAFFQSDCSHSKSSHRYLRKVFGYRIIGSGLRPT